MNLQQALERIADLEAELSLYRVDEGLEEALQNAFRRESAERGHSGNYSGWASKCAAALYRARGRTLSRLTLLDRINPDLEASCVSVAVVQVRKMFGQDGVRTVWGIGYAMTPAGLARVDAVLAHDQAFGPLAARA